MVALTRDEILATFQVQDNHSACWHWWRLIFGRRGLAYRPESGGRRRICDECYWRGCFYGMRERVRLLERG